MQPEPRAGALRTAKLLIWVIPLLWIVNSVIARRATDVITPHVLAWGRWALAGAILAWFTRAELWQHRQELRTHWRRYLLLGACGMWICGAAVYFAGQTTTMMNISLIYAASPVMIALGSVLWLREAFSKRQSLGVVLALVGVVHVVVQGQWLLLTQVVFVPGDLWIAAAATAWAAYSMLQKHWGSPMSASAQLAVICAAGVVVLTPFSSQAWQCGSMSLMWVLPWLAWPSDNKMTRDTARAVPPSSCSAPCSQPLKRSVEPPLCTLSTAC